MRTTGIAVTGFWTGAACVLLGAAAAFGQAGQGSDGQVPAPTPSASSFPCEEDEKFREFDFWMGEWDVHTADGKLAGKNVIESSQRGCVLTESWNGAGGSSGISMNYLDKTSDEWVQVWTDAGGSQIVVRGGLTDSGMLLEGQIHYVSNGVTAPFRGLWTLQPDGRVRQFFEQSDDGGKTWKPWFEGFYTRVGADGKDGD
jgi:hypothetical protein